MEQKSAKIAAIFVADEIGSVYPSPSLHADKGKAFTCHTERRKAKVEEK
jgi:hypothetical protein